MSTATAMILMAGIAVIVLSSGCAGSEDPIEQAVERSRQEHRARDNGKDFAECVASGDQWDGGEQICISRGESRHRTPVQFESTSASCGRFYPVDSADHRECVRYCASIPDARIELCGRR